LCAWLTTPMPYLPVRLAGTIASGAAFGVRARRVGWMAAGVVAGLAGCGRSWRSRRPVDIATYRLSRELTRRRALPWDVVHGRMPRAGKAEREMSTSPVLKMPDVSGREHYRALYRHDLETQAEWHRRGATNKADSISMLLRQENVQPHRMVELGCGTG